MERLEKFISGALFCCGFLLALVMGYSDLRPDAALCTGECVKVHGSSFGRFLGVPLGFWGAGALGVALVLYLLKRRKTASMVLAGMTGVEAYLTLIEFVSIHAVCPLCLAFFMILVTGLVTITQKDTLKAVCGILGSVFFITHFVMFPPGVGLSPNLMRMQRQAQVEVFASPTCGHCEKAIKELKYLCAKNDTDLIFRPVAISPLDRQASLNWICKRMFTDNSVSSKRLAWQIISENEAALKRLDEGKVAVPLIILKERGRERIFHGWNRIVKSALAEYIGGENTSSSLRQISPFETSYGGRQASILSAGLKGMCRASGCDQ